MEIRDGTSVPLGRIMRYLREDATKNLFAIYDLLNEREDTTISIATGEGDEILGYLLRYKGLGYPTAIIRGSKPAVASFLDEVRGEKMVLFLDSAKDMEGARLNATSVIKEDLMAVRADGAKLQARDLARRLGPADAAEILGLYTGHGPPRGNNETYARWAERHVVYGVFRKGALVSVAGTWAEADDGWVVGGVYTSPSHRGMGFATAATSAVTTNALKNATQSALFVASSNMPAIRVYEKLGYRKVGERIWVDLGTGIRPLTSEP